MKFTKAFLAIGVFILIGLVEQYEKLNQWWNYYILITTEEGPNYVKRKYIILWALSIVFFIVLLISIVIFNCLALVTMFLRIS
jgi:hypothetical protein